jgi:hypothetical protein
MNNKRMIVGIIYKNGNIIGCIEKNENITIKYNSGESISILTLEEAKQKIKSGEILSIIEPYNPNKIPNWMLDHL